MATPLLENDRYQLFMQGGVHRWTHTGTSDHYHDYEDHYQQWRGTGVVIDKTTGQSVQFNFLGPANRSGPAAPDLKALILRVDIRYKNALAQELALPNQEINLVSFVCERLLAKVVECRDPIKSVTIDNIPLAELVRAGIVADSSGQIHLGIPVPVPGLV